MRIFIDLDGTAAEWRTDATMEDLKKKGYFASLKTNPNIVKALNVLMTREKELDWYILSATISEQAKEEKRHWVHAHLPKIPEEKILFSINGKSKGGFGAAKFGGLSKKDILIDDFTKNLKEWEENGGSGIKFKNKINGKSGKYSYFLSENDGVEKIIDDFYQIIKVLK